MVFFRVRGGGDGRRAAGRGGDGAGSRGGVHVAGGSVR